MGLSNLLTFTPSFFPTPTRGGVAIAFDRNLGTPSGVPSMMYRGVSRLRLTPEIVPMRHDQRFLSNSRRNAR
jgi:hypothetical protein